MNRRDFQSISWFDPSATADVPDVSLVRCSRRAMATLFELLLPLDTLSPATVANAVFDRVEELEAQLTVYRDDSEMSRINREAADRPILVEPALFALLADAARLTRETGGAFDITAGPLIKTWGFFRREGRMPTPGERQDALSRVGMKSVELNADRRTIRFRKPGVEINLGSIGKGFALDRGAELVRDAGIRHALLHAGGSSVLALGCQPAESRGWPVGIRHPWDESKRLATVFLRDRALATSAATFQHFEYNKRKLGHLIDPRTGRPAEGIASATAVAPTATQADALATAFFVLGTDKTKAYCQTHPGVAAVLLPDGATSPIVIGLNADELDLPRADSAPGRTES